ncbi:MAG: hypothetical protein JOY67_14590 [Hyphomicrobiales bacterium]|nr:hypothetical protein [Hyphomicrobiales bacterium]
MTAAGNYTADGRAMPTPSLFSRPIADSFGLCSRLVLIVTAVRASRGQSLHAALTIRDEHARFPNFCPCHPPRDWARIENGDSSRLCSPDAPKVNASWSAVRKPVNETLPFALVEKVGRPCHEPDFDIRAAACLSVKYRPARDAGFPAPSKGEMNP